jgi:geranylgeranyl pyrophosphate synthase
LFAAACQIAGVVAERDEKGEEALASYGRYLGIAFQLVDDAIDYASDDATMGKSRGDDFRDGKMTLPVILAMARGNEADRAFWKEAMEGRRVSDDDLAYAKTLLDGCRALPDTFEKARLYGQRAIDALGPFRKPNVVPKKRLPMQARLNRANEVPLTLIGHQVKLPELRALSFDVPWLAFVDRLTSERRRL